ncbi:MAG: hypothetical protein ACRD19_00020 [Terriglobia bacterium]
MAQRVLITISYDFNNDWWLASDSPNNFPMFQADEPREVHDQVRKWRRHFEQSGYDVTVNWPTPWPPNHEDLEDVFAKRKGS